MNKLIIITGQTSTGKTKLALEFAQKYHGELINCDSRQIYKYLNIITGKDLNKNSKVKSPASPAGRQKSKPSQTRSKPHLESKNFLNQFFKIKKLNHFDIGYYLLGDRTSAVEEDSDVTSEDGKTAEVKLWLYDIVMPVQYFSSFDYQKCTLWVIKKILPESKTPIIVGGTYLYLKHLLYGVETENIPPDWKLRKKLAKATINELQKKLKRLDIQSFNRLNISEKNNPQRLIRKIEIATFIKKHKATEPPWLRRNPETKFRINSETGKPRRLNDDLAKKFGLKKVQFNFIGLKFKDSESLRKAIEKRVEERLKQGAIDEVKNLLKMGYKESDPGLKTIGYQQLIAYLKGKLSKEEATHQWINKEVQYAKRQYTFMKKDKNITWKLV